MKWLKKHLKKFLIGIGIIGTSAVFMLGGGCIPETNIKDILVSKTTQEKSIIKSNKIATASCLPIGEYTKGEYLIEIQSLKAIEINGIGGVEIMARAWKGTTQLGFGKDGSVEIERFRIWNPPIMAPDGTTRMKEVPADDSPDMSKTKLVEVDNFSENPVKAIQEVLADTISIVGKDTGQIIKEKIGNTTDIFYPVDGANDPVDGLVYTASEASWTLARQTGTVNAASSGEPTTSMQNTTSGGNYWVGRAIWVFATATIPDADTINSATLSLYQGATVNNEDSMTQHIVDAAPASFAAIGTADFLGAFTLNGDTSFGSIALASISTNAYNDFTLNASGLANISKTGDSAFGGRLSGDINDSAPTVGLNRMTVNYADTEAGTTHDPKLTVVHSGVATPPRLEQEIIWFQ